MAAIMAVEDEAMVARAASEKRLLARARHFEDALQSVGEAIITADVFGHVEQMNRAAEELTGWSSGEATGKPLLQVCPIQREQDPGPAGDDFTTKADASVLRARTTAVLTTREGRHVTVEDEVDSIVADGGLIIGMVVLLRNVQEKRHAEERIAISERLASIATLVVGIAHEIGSPLAGVIANVDRALGELQALGALIVETEAPLATASHMERLRLINSSLIEVTEGAQRIRDVMADLGGSSPPSSTSAAPAELDLASLLGSAAAVARPDVEKRARFRIKLGPLPLCHGSEAGLVQAFAGLLSGAADAIAAGNPEEQEVRLEAHTDEHGRAVVVVSDTGRPLSPAEHHHLFDPFFARSDHRPGNGLGLWISHRVLSEHHARIRVESKSDRGNKIIVSLDANHPKN